MSHLSNEFNFHKLFLSKAFIIESINLSVTSGELLRPITLIVSTFNSKECLFGVS